MNTTARPDPHQDCLVSAPCAAADPDACPAELGRRIRIQSQAAAWSLLALRKDEGGFRHYLDGKAVHCGDTIELQAIEEHHDDHGPYSVPVQLGTPVRYESDLYLPTPETTLFASVAGRVFAAALSPSMRFRWPRTGDAQ